MKNYNTLFLALMCATPLAEAEAVGLPELEEQTLSHDRRLELAKQDTRIANARLTQSEARNGWSLLGIATGGNVNNQNNQNYTAYGYSVGASYPLLGTRANLKKQVNEARQQVEINEAKTAMLAGQSLTELRQSYLDVWFAEEQARLAHVFLSERDNNTNYLQKRRQKGLLLASEEQSYLGIYAEADAHSINAEQLAYIARQKLSLLTGLTPEQLQKVDMPKLGVNIASNVEMNLETEVPPNVRLAKQVLENQQKRLENPAWRGIEAAINFSYSDGRDGFVLSVPSRSTQVAVNFRMPLQISKLNRGYNEEAAAQLDRNRADYEDVQARYALDKKQAIAEYRAALANLKASDQELRTASQALKERNLRSRSLQGDELEKRLQARSNYYRMARQQLNNWHQLQLASIKLTGLGFPVSQTNAMAFNDNIMQPLQKDTPIQFAMADSYSKSDVSYATENESLGISLPQTENSLPSTQIAMAERPRPAAHTESETQSPISAAAVTVKEAEVGSAESAKFSVNTGSYMWKSEPALQDPRAQVEQWKRYGLTRMLIGLNKQQLSESDLYSRVDQLVNIAHAQHIKIELLLGDADWITSKGRPQLINLLQRLKTLKVDGINLDLEIEQLPGWKAHQTSLVGEWLSCLSDAAKISPWPVSATFHHRHLQIPRLGERLKAAGIAEADIMIFSTNLNRVVTTAKQARQTLGNFPFALVQSVERQLPPTESHATKGVASLVELSRQLQQQGDVPMLVQSWEDLRTLKP